jgi:hypothetical protein
MKMITCCLFQALLLIDSFAEVVPSSFTRSGNAYSLNVVDNHDPSNPIYELRRTNPVGLSSVLWRNIPDSRPKTPGLTIIALELSPIMASIEEDNETSLLIFDGPSDALVFRFPSDATQASYARIKYLRRGRDPVAPLRFKHHGVLYFDTGNPSAEQVIQFDEEGIITHDFRPPTGLSGRTTSYGPGWKLVIDDPKAPVPESSPFLRKAPATTNQALPSSTPEMSRNAESNPNHKPVAAPLAARPNGWIVPTVAIAGIVLTAIWWIRRRSP